MALHPFAGEAQDRVAPARVDALNLVDVGDEPVDPVLLERGGKPVPVAQRVIADLAVISRSDHDQAGDAVRVFQGKADHRVGALIEWPASRTGPPSAWSSITAARSPLSSGYP